MYSGADPGFPIGGGANPPGRAPRYDFSKFREKLHEIENILGRILRFWTNNVTNFPEVSGIIISTESF